MERGTRFTGGKACAELTKRDLVKALEIVERTLVISTENELRNVLLEIGQLVPCDYIISGLARTDDCGQFVGPLQTVNASYPADWFTLYMEEEYAAVDPILQANFSRYGTQVWSETFKQARSRREREFIGEAESFALREGLTLGVKCPSQPVGSVFSFSGRHMADHHRHAAVLERLVPHLHQALLRLTLLPSAANPLLSSREREVLLWIKEGKTNWEIARILRVSEQTVKFHVGNILRKLDTSTRGQAVAVALQQGLIAI